MATDNFETEIPLDKLSVLLDIGGEFYFDPVSSTEMEAHFVRLLAGFDGSPADFEPWLREVIRPSFRFVSSPPRWIQNPQWQFGMNGPMLFIGQVDCKPIDGVLHDESAFYVFFDPASGELKTVSQVA